MRRNADSTLNALSARGVGVNFEGLCALEGVDLDLARGEILGLIGPNGAGKTTLINVLSGYQKPSEGFTELDGQPTTGWAPHRFPRRGLGRTFQAARLFPDMTVLENVEMAGVGIGLSRAHAREDAVEILDYLDIAPRRHVTASALAYGEQRLVGIGRALAIKPRYLLLDEPAAGLSPQEAADLLTRITAIRNRYGCGILVIEHNMQLIMKLCDRVQVLALGKTISIGSPTEVQRDARVREAYLGATYQTGLRVRNRAKATVSKDIAPLLKIENIVVDYGSVRAVSNVSIAVGRGEFVAVIGPNGAGKSTLLSAIAGLTHDSSGAIFYDARPLSGVGAAARVEMGIALVPEGRRILSNLTVEENLRIGQTTRRSEPEAARRFEEVLDRFPVLRSRLKGHAGKLSGGEQQQLAIARALLAEPKLLLLDEPSLGLAPLMIDSVYETLSTLSEGGLAILLMEQNANRALLAADRAYVLRHGVVELEGSADALRADPAFDRAYFGFDTREGVAIN
jgi:branched-chain amino acid transport system ATP-binding protein